MYEKKYYTEDGLRKNYWGFFLTWGFCPYDKDTKLVKQKGFPQPSLLLFFETICWHPINSQFFLPGPIFKCSK